MPDLFDPKTSGGTLFTFNDISINTIEPLSNDYMYMFVVSCHGKEYDIKKTIILNEDTMFDNIGLGNRFGHLAFTSAHKQKTIPLHNNNEESNNSGPEILQHLNQIINNVQINEGYYINGLSHEVLSPACDIDTDTNERIDFIPLNSMGFRIKKSDYEGILLGPSILSNTNATEGEKKKYRDSEAYINEFGLYLYKFCKFKATLIDNRTTVDLDIAINKKQLKGFHDISEIHEYFSNSNRDIDTLNSINQKLVKDDIRSYMEPDQKCTWNTLINMCYDTIDDIKEKEGFEDINEKSWYLRVLCCRETTEGVASSNTPFKLDLSVRNYAPELVNDNTMVPFYENKIYDERINNIYNDLSQYLNNINNTFRDEIARTENVHFITSHPELLLVFLLLTVINPIIFILGNPTDRYTDNDIFTQFFLRIHTITIQNKKYDLFKALLILTANTNIKSKKYARKKISLLGNPTNKRLYMQELLDKLNMVIDTQQDGAYDRQEKLRSYLTAAINNDNVTTQYTLEEFDPKVIVDNIIMLTKTRNFMINHGEQLNSNNSGEDVDSTAEDAMDVDSDSSNMDIDIDSNLSEYLRYNFTELESESFLPDILIDSLDYLRDLTDDLFNYDINTETFKTEKRICMYFTAAKEVELNEGESNEEQSNEEQLNEEAVFIFILDIKGFSVYTYLIGLKNDNFKNSEMINEEGYVKYFKDFSNTTQNMEDPGNIKFLLNRCIYEGCILPLYQRGFNYIDLIYRHSDSMKGGGPTKKRIIDEKLRPSTDLRTLKQENFKSKLIDMPELEKKEKFVIKKPLTNVDFSSNDDIVIDNFFPLNLTKGPLKPVNEVGSPPREVKSPLQVSTPGSDVILGSRLPPNERAPNIKPAFNYGSPGRTPIRLPGSPPRSKSDSDILKRRREFEKLEKNIPPLNFEDYIGELEEIPKEQISSSKSEPLFKISPSMSKSPSVQQLEALGQLQSSESDYLVGKDVPVGDIELKGGKKRNSKKRKVKKNGKTKKKRVKKRNAKKNK